MNWLSLLSVALSNSHVRSFLLGLSGVVGTYLTQYLSGQDFGPTLTPLVAAGLTAESATDWMDKKTGQTHRIWTPKPDHPDNHWLDATKMAALGCFELGCKLAYVEKRDTTKKKAPRVSYH